LYLSNSKSKSLEIVEKIRPMFGPTNREKITNRQQFMTFLKNLTPETITDAEYSYCLVNFYRIILELRLFHILTNESPEEISGLFEFWTNVSEQLIQSYMNKNINKTAQYLKNILSDKVDSIIENLSPESGKARILSPFNKALQNIEDLVDSEQTSYSHFQDSLQDCQKILFELKEFLSMSGIVSPVLYEITKLARELPRSYTNKNELIKDLKEKIPSWENRLKNSPTKSTKKVIN
jgi:hypothetical protein